MASAIAISTHRKTIQGVFDDVRAHTWIWDQEPDHWERSPALNGLLAWGGEQDLETVTTWLDRSIATQTTEGHLAHGGPLFLKAGHVASFVSTGCLTSAFGLALLDLHELNGEQRFLDAAVRQMGGLLAAPRTTDGGFWGRAEGPELWIDMTYMICGFLAKYGQVTGDSSSVDEAFAQWEIHADHLVDKHTQLGRHTWCEKPNSYPQSTLWSRGNGWLICAAVDLLEFAPEHPRAGAVREQLVRTLAAVGSHQDASGFLRNVLDDVSSPFESSGTLMFAYAVAKAVRLGILDSSELDKAVRALRVVAGYVGPDGGVRGVTVPPGGPGVPLSTAAYGQGFFLLAAAELHAHVDLAAPKA